VRYIGGEHVQAFESAFAGPPMEEYLWVANMCRSLGHRLLLFPFDGAFDTQTSSPRTYLRADLAGREPSAPRWLTPAGDCTSSLQGCGRLRPPPRVKRRNPVILAWHAAPAQQLLSRTVSL